MSRTSTSRAWSRGSSWPSRSLLFSGLFPHAAHARALSPATIVVVGRRRATRSMRLRIIDAALAARGSHQALPGLSSPSASPVRKGDGLRIVDLEKGRGMRRWPVGDVIAIFDFVDEPIELVQFGV